jgi:hypothetical protein
VAPGGGSRRPGPAGRGRVGGGSRIERWYWWREPNRVAALVEGAGPSGNRRCWGRSGSGGCVRRHVSEATACGASMDGTRAEALGEGGEEVAAVAHPVGGSRAAAASTTVEESVSGDGRWHAAVAARGQKGGGGGGLGVPGGTSCV